ncbi:MAG: SH3 domain-containing protein [Chloroflexota bacterium]|nr:SH3 domain-containing protein [Chloroflexota bacterium]
MPNPKLENLRKAAKPGWSPSNSSTTPPSQNSLRGGGIAVVVLVFLLCGFFYFKPAVTSTDTNYSVVQAGVTVISTGGNSNGPSSIKTNDSNNQTSPSSHPTVMFVDAEALNMREGPGTDYPIVEKLFQDYEVTLLNEEQVVDGSLWVKVSINEEVGWVNKKFLRY